MKTTCAGASASPGTWMCPAAAGGRDSGIIHAFCWKHAGPGMDARIQRFILDFLALRIGRAEWRDSATATPHGIGAIRGSIAHLAEERRALALPLGRRRRLEEREPLLEVCGRRAGTGLRQHQIFGSLCL